MPMSGWKYGRCGPSCFYPDCDCKQEWFDPPPARDAPAGDKCEYCGKIGHHNEVCVMNEVMQLRAKVEQSNVALRFISIHATYPVSTEINPRGYAWRGEEALDEAKRLADLAIASLALSSKESR